MARSRRYILSEGAPPRLEVTTRAFWKNTEIRLDGQPVGTIVDPKALREGRDFPLPDGTSLHVQLVSGFLGHELQLLRDGEPLPGSGSHPGERLRVATIAVWFIAGLNILLGAVGMMRGGVELGGLQINVGTFVTGLLFAVLAVFTARRSKVALGIALALFCVDSIWWLSLLASPEGGSMIGGLIMRVFLIATMVRGLSAITELQKRETSIANTPVVAA